MTGFVYSLLRFAPNPATGEFVNLGAVAGSEATGEWGIRHVQNDQRARALSGSVPVSAFYEFYERLSDEIESHVCFCSLMTTTAGRTRLLRPG